MKIKQFFYNRDNLAYLLFSGSEALAIDGGAVDEILAFVARNGLTLTMVTNTHGHEDHTAGTKRLVRESGATYLDHHRFSDKETILLGKEALSVRLTPGHTEDSVSYAADDFLITGDTLFNGTVGYCFSEDLNAFYQSIRLLMAYPGTTRIFAGHDYVKESIVFARHLTPENPAIDAFAARYDSSHVFSSIGR